MKKMKTSLKKRQHRAGSKTSKKLMMDSTSRSRSRRRRGITQLPHCVGTTFYWLLLRSTSHYKLHVSKNLLCWILSALCFQNLGNHRPTTENSSLRLQPPILVARAPYLTTIAVFCLSTFFCFPLFIHLPFFAANEIVLIQHYNHPWFAKTQKSFTDNY